MTTSIEPTKRCTRCKKTKAVSEFCKNRCRHDGRDPWCYACKTNARLLRAYGISSEDYEAMFKDQGGVCKICKRTPRRTLHVDHCHQTGKVRGLLCEDCNRGLGCFSDEPALLQTALNYISGTDLFYHVQSPNVPGQRCSQAMEEANL
jgi:hypothetical protein